MYGLSWIFGALVVSSDQSGSFALQLVFALLNTFQGFLIFLFFCVLGKDTREAWKEFLCRRKLKTKFYSKSRSKAFKQQYYDPYGTNPRNNPTSSTLLRITQTDTLKRALPSNTLTSDTSSISSTLDRRTIHQGHVPSFIIPGSEIEIEQIQLESVMEVDNETANAAREQQIVILETGMMFENTNGEGVGDDQSESIGEGEGVGDDQSESNGKGVGDDQSESNGEGVGDDQSESNGEGVGDNQSESNGEGVGDDQSESNGEGVGNGQNESNSEGVGDNQSESNGEGVGDDQSESNGEGVGDDQSESNGRGVRDDQSESQPESERLAINTTRLSSSDDQSSTPCDL